MSLTFTVDNEEKLHRVTEKLVPTLKHQQVIFMEGIVGSGKTTFIRHLFQTLAKKYNSNFFFLGSPTYQRENKYCFNRFNFIHFDFYQVENNPKIDLEDYLLDHCLLVEWPLENLKKRFEHEALFINISIELKKRVVEFNSKNNQWLQKIL